MHKGSESHEMKRVIIVAAIVVGVCVAYVLAHLALIEVGREVVVVHEPTPSGGVRKARLWIVDDGRYSWIHPGNANAQWWVQHMDEHPIVEIERGGNTRQYRASPDPEAHTKVHKLLREKYGVADWWVRFLAGSDTQSGLLTFGEKCKTVPIRLEPVVSAP
jgi:glycine/D-amino acid oxidase-like deaminating enzyme